MYPSSGNRLQSVSVFGALLIYMVLQKCTHSKDNFKIYLGKWNKHVVKEKLTSNSELSCFNMSSISENSFNDPRRFRLEPSNWDLNSFKMSLIPLKSDLPFKCTFRKWKKLLVSLQHNFKLGGSWMYLTTNSRSN